MGSVLTEGRSYVAGRWVTGERELVVENPADESTAGTVTVTPEVFDPLGNPSFTVLHYAMDHANYIGTVRILDDRGRVIRTVVDNALLGISGVFRWDGDRDDGSKARVGYYLVSLEVFDPSGMSHRYHKAVAIAAPF